ncbi:MAG: TonB-dependent receptor [Bacteroidetes bacterium]|nr:TonB-dependent receptor [Bacteroidota bacterium]MCY4206088.1 TonB-dependent receptor [Bacteroidota bacterium]
MPFIGSFRLIGIAPIFLLLISSQVNAQVGTISGIIVDGENGENLIGATAAIDGSTLGDATDLNGRYEFAAEPGTYTMKFSYIGFSTVTVKNVVVVSGEITRLEIELLPEAISYGEVIVAADVIEGSEAGLLRERARSVAVSDAISAEAISRSGSGDAAAAMSKVTGASVVGGRYVYIRGLGDRYANTTLNGSTLPSADPDRKAFQLDLFPAALLDNIVTLKTFTPDKPGDFSGGLVDVATKAFPESFTLQLSASLTYDDQSSRIDNFLSYPGSSTDWLGYDDGLRALPDVLENKNPEDQLPRESDLRDLRRGVTNEIRANRADSLNAFSRAFNGIMTPALTSTPVNHSFSAAAGGKMNLFGRPLGITGSLTYGRSYSYYDDGVFSQWRLVGGDVASTENLSSTTYFGPNPDLDLITRADPKEAPSFENIQSSDEVNWGTSATIAFQPRDNHEIVATVLRTQSGSSNSTSLGGFRDQTGGTTFVTRTLSYQERSLYSLQLRGEHILGPLQIEWKTSLANNSQEEPDLRFFSGTQNVRESASKIDTTYSLGGGNAPPPQRYFRDLNEDSHGAVLDITIPFRQWSGLATRVKLGGRYDFSERGFRQRRFEYHEGREIDYRYFRGDAQAYFSDRNVGVLDTLHVGDIVAYNAGLYIQENSPARSNYDATRDITAGYLMLELPLTRKLKIIGGARLESTQITSESHDQTLPDSLRVGELDNQDWLPSINVVYALSENMNFRLAATRTIARPTYRELAPFQSFNFVGGDVQEGNPLLTRTLISNYDVRWEMFARAGEIVALSAFYKIFKDPIERVLRNVGEGRFVSFQNVDHAKVFGAEVEARKRLSAWTSLPVLKNLSVGGNFSLVRSQVDIPEEEMVIIRASAPNASSSRSLEGQSPFLLNLSTSYENYTSGTVIGLYYTVFGDRLLSVTEGATPDVFEKARNDLDVTISQDLPANLRLKISAKNLLKSDVRQIQTFKDRVYDYISYSRSRTIGIGISYIID